MSSSLWPHGLQHTRLAYPSLSPGVCSNSCPLSWSYYPIISSSVTPFSSRPQSFPASGSLPVKSTLCISVAMYWSFSLFNEYSGLISIRINWFDLLAAQGTLKSFLQHHNSKAPILPYMTTGKRQLWLYRPLWAKWCLCFLICYLGLS